MIKIEVGGIAITDLVSNTIFGQSQLKLQTTKIIITDSENGTEGMNPYWWNRTISSTKKRSQSAVPITLLKRE